MFSFCNSKNSKQDFTKLLQNSSLIQYNNLDMFKKRNTQKKVDIAKDIEDIQVNQQEQHQEQITVPKSIATKKINKFSNQIKKQVQQPEKPHKPIVVKYGLIDKDQVNSKYHSHQQTQQVKHPEKHSIINLYVKKKMEELTGNNQQGREKERDINAEQIMKMQKKYLQMSEQKLAQYDIVQILKRLQNTATSSIKTQIEGRNAYMKNLLENEHEKMEYASKKQLKTIKQQKQRIEQQFRNKYTEAGRRGYVQKMKHQAMLNK